MQIDAFRHQMPQNLQLDMLTMIYCTVAHDHQKQMDATPNVRLVYVTRGEATFTLANGILHAPTRSMVYLPSNTPYTSHWLGQPESEFAVIDIHMKDEQGRTIGFGDEATILFCDEYHLYDGYVSDIRRQDTEDTPFLWLERVALALRLCCDVARERTPDDGTRRLTRIVPGVRFLEQHYMDSCPTSELARMCMLSESSFRKQFFELKGMPPVDYRNSLRIRRAVQLIRMGECTVSEAAIAVGIPDIKYFSKLFKKTVGVSPTQIRKQSPWPHV